MPGGYDKHQRFIAETAEPSGAVHYEEFPIAVRYTNIVTRPTLETTYDGWVLAWTSNAVLVLWIETRTGGKNFRTRWVPAHRVQRLQPPELG
jgi:hypothetical protein